jgi:predicted permease
MSVIGLLDSFARDIRYALRMLRHNPMFTSVALLTLAIGIGANTAVFSVVNSVLLNPLHYPKSEQLVALRQAAPGAAGLTNVSDGLLLSPSMYFTYAEQNRSFQSMGVWVPMTATITGLTEPEQVRGIAVSDGVLQALGVAPAAGRGLSTADQIPGGRPTVMLSYGYWQQRFGGERSTIGRNIIVDALPREIIGVMPQGFRMLDRDLDLVVPLALDRRRAVLPGFGFQGIARLKQGVTIEQANADLARLVPVWMNSWPTPGGNPKVYESWRITPALRPLKEEVVGDVRSILWVVMGTIGVVMLIACANVANLVLVHIDARQKELSIRAALGAGKARIARSLLLESVILSVMGGALGIVFADQGLRVLAIVGQTNLPRMNEIVLDSRALAFTVAISILCGLLFGLIPALRYAGPRVSAALRSAGRHASANRERRRASNLLVVAQVSMALVLLVSAGLMIRTFRALRTVDPGFTDARSLQTMRTSIPTTIASPDAITRMQNQVVEKLDAIPGVQSAAFASSVPMEGVEFNWDAIRAEGQPDLPAGEIPPLRMFKYVSPGFFGTIGSKLIAGRDLSWTDMYGHRSVALVSENLARELWGSPSAAVGKRFRYIVSSPLREVIGVVEDVRENGVQSPPPAIVYWPTMTTDLFGPGPLNALPSVTFTIRSNRAGTESFLNEVRQAVWSVDSNLPIAASRTMEEIYNRRLARTSFTLVMLGIAGGMALVLGIIGIYGVIAYTVSQRRREIGIRLALGAQPIQVRRMFVRHGMKLAGFGLAIGLGIAAVLTRLMSSVLFGVHPTDPITFLTMAIVLAVAAILASYLPALRASRVDPVETLAAE